MKGIEEMGYRIPTDIAVVGFSNWRLSSLITPQLSSVEQNGAEMGRKVIDLFLKIQRSAIFTNPKTYTQEIIPAKFIIRTSSKRKET